MDKSEHYRNGNPYATVLWNDIQRLGLYIVGQDNKNRVGQHLAMNPSGVRRDEVVQAGQFDATAARQAKAILSLFDKMENKAYQNGVSIAQNWINRRMDGESREDIENVDGFVEGGQFHPIRGSEDYNRVRGGDERAFSKKKKK